MRNSFTKKRSSFVGYPHCGGNYTFHPDGRRQLGFVLGTFTTCASPLPIPTLSTRGLPLPPGLIISEATQVSNDGQGYPCTPGVFTPEQIAGWKKITDAVHAKVSPRAPSL